MDEIDKIGMAASLPHTECDLDHSDKDPGPHPAIDFLDIPMGLTNEDGTQEKHDDLVIAVCTDCREGLFDAEWSLLYCLDCNKSQWVYRGLTRIPYEDGIHYFHGCPHCKISGGRKREVGL